MMTTDAQQLLDLKERIATAKTNRARAEGELVAAKNRLEEDFGCKTIAAATKELAKLKGTADDANAKVAQLVDRLEIDFDWEDEGK